MKRRVVAATIALALFGVAGFAFGAGAGIVLSGTGPQPATVTVNWGDTVTFSNGDGVEHGVSIPRAEVSSPPIPPGGTFEHAFEARGGNYLFRQLGPKNFGGQVVVRVDGTVSLTSATQVVPFGKTLTLKGKSSFPGKPVVIRARDASTGSDWKVAIETTAGSDGSYTGTLRPTVGARYEARVAADQVRSSLLSVAVKPLLSIGVRPRVAPAGTRIVVKGRIRPAGAARGAELTAFDKRRKRWVTVQTKRVDKKGRIVFQAKLEEGAVRLRISIGRGAIGAGYTPIDSRFVTVTGTTKKKTT
jgi:hypothetical protein